ncbi:MAG: hypothetical protein KC983_09345, partial [Phycisphaerales bacterium]|nr:hypothetical protein [Phycisphaerales bacterium]
MILAVMMLIIVFNLDDPNKVEKTAEKDPFDGVEHLDVPTPLNLDGPTTDGAPLATESSVALPQGGWIQTTNDQGELAQQYRAASLDPNPPGARTGSVAMQGLEAQLFLKDGRIVTLDGDEALVYAPNNVLNEGRINGNVVIRIFEPESLTADLADETPTVEIHTTEATFDNFSGEINCPDHIDVQTSNAHFVGNGLLITINETRGRIEYLRVDDVDFIRFLADDAMATAVARNTPRPAHRVSLASMRTQATPEDAKESPASRRKKAAKAPAVKPVQFYVATLETGIRIVQGDSTPWREATGDVLRLVFAFEGTDTSSESPPAAPPSAETDDSTEAPAAPSTESPSDIDTTAMRAPSRLTDVFTGSVFGAMQDGSAASTPRRGGLFQPDVPDDVITVTCEGPLVMVPATEPADQLAGADHMRLGIIANDSAPVTLRDYRDQLTATFGDIMFEAPNDRVTMTAGSRMPVIVTSPDLDGEGETFIYDRAQNLASFRGAGWLLPRQAAMRDAGPSPDPSLAPAGDSESINRLRIAWTRGADFELANIEPDNRLALRKVHIDGDVDIESDRGRIACDEIDLALYISDDGQSVPESMLATGNVQARDDSLTLRASELEVIFRPESFLKCADGAASPAADDGDHVFGGTSRIRQLTARSNVRLLLTDGSYSFSDELFADTDAQTVRLAGEHVLIATDRMALRTANRIDVHRTKGLVWSDWPGEARIYDQPLMLADGADDRFETVNALFDADSTMPSDLRIRWSDGMTLTFTEPTAPEGTDPAVVTNTDPAITGVLFRGNVRVDAPEGSMAGDELDLALTVGDDGTSSPSRLHVVGRVSAHDPDLSLWTDDLVVTFRAPEDRPAKSSVT